MKIVYKLIERTQTEIPTAPTYYGIGAYRYDKKEKAYIALREIHGITDDKDKLLELVQACNECKLYLVHMDDVVADFLYELEYTKSVL